MTMQSRSTAICSGASKEVFRPRVTGPPFRFWQRLSFWVCMRLSPAANPLSANTMPTCGESARFYPAILHHSICLLDCSYFNLPILWHSKTVLRQFRGF
ncbi:hypothetical protein VTK73DRAFT_4853 [Phialemonium thermophilum]|uniref:Uncharacterized protein n=1 Tax=Phialemonium thermophilum TaxID=223376 RepID=A0ABR3WRE3_9PEZI